jgi:hypothetical protein
VIKGSIEDISPQVVSGWIYCEAAPLRDATILAFSGRDCIGIGKVGYFRQDLADAGLDDGHLGFSFPINLPEGAELASVVVRLDNAEAVLMQRQSRLTGLKTATRIHEPTVDETLRRIRWMRRRNMLAPAEYDFLRGLTRFGVCEVSLDMDAAASQPVANSAAITAKKLLELIVLNEVSLKLEYIASGDALLEALHSAADREGSLSHVVMWSATPTRLGVVEAGHLAKAVGIDVAGAVDYHLDPSTALVVHTRCTIVPRPGSAYQSMLVISGTAGEDLLEAASTCRSEMGMHQS